MAVGTGIGFDYTKLSKAFDDLDAKLKALTAEGKNFETTMKNAFASMSKGDFKDFADKVATLRKDVVAFGKQKVGLQWDSRSLQEYINDVNRLILVINEIKKDAKGSHELKGTGISIQGLKKELKDAQELLRVVKQVEKEMAAKTKDKNQTYAGAMAYSTNAKTMEQERQAIINLEAAREKLVKTDANYATQLNNINVAIERHTNNIREAMKTDAQKTEESRKKAEATRKEAEAQRKANEEAYRSTTVGALGYSRNAKSLGEIRQAMRYLEVARSKEKLDTKESRENYRQLTDELARQTKTYEGLTGRVAEKQKGLLNISSQLGRQLATVFSVSQITGYVNKLAQVRGEFELQQRSLQAILQNKNEANEIWNKTTELAVKSPFRVKELTSYTKQLAAYRIESDKLYDTNKMLADVSAGLGVDMQRLILAYGQVKAANFLRGTELRQFTEAGVPMLDELAKHLEKVKGRSFEVAEVFDMISKRMITFADVEQVFQNLTQAGGTFYRMQEIQSETLRGQISNLKDSIDLMLNDIGKSTEGTMKNAVGAVKALVDNYEKLIPVLKTVIALMAVQGVHTLSMSRRMLALGRLSGVLLKNGARGYSVMQMLNIGVQTLTRSFIKGLTSIGKFVATNPWLLFAAVVVGTFAKIRSENNKYRKSLEAIDKEHARVAQSLQAIGIGFDKSIDDKNYDDAKKQLTQLISLAEREYNLKFNIEVGKLDDEQVKKTFEDIERQLTTVGVKAADFSKALEQGFLLEDDFTKDLQDLNSSSSAAFQSMQSFAVSLAYNLQNAKDNGEALTKQQEDALRVIRDGKQDNQSQLDYFESLREAITTIVGDYEKYVQEVRASNGQNKKAVENLESITKRLKLLGVNIDAIRPLFSLFGGFDKDVKEAQREFDYFIKRLETKDFASMSEEDLLATLTVAVDTEGANRKWNDFVKDHVKRWLEEVYPIKFKPVIDDTPDAELLAWQESYNNLFEGKAGFEKIDKKATQHEKVIKRLNGEYEKQKDLVEQIAKAGTKGAYQRYNLEEERKKLQEINVQLAWFGVSPKDKGKDEVLEKLKNRINLIKEMNKEYEKLNKTFSKAESLAKVQKAYADTAKELGLDTSTMSFTDEGTIKSLEALLGKPEYAANKYVIELQKALDNFKVELGVEVKQERDKDLKAQVQELFDQYDLSVELKKLNIPKDLAKSLFDVDYLDLNGLKKAVQSQGVKFLGTDMEDEYRKFLEKIDDMEDKAAKERMKTYVKYLQEGMSERVKLKIEELRKLKEIEESDEFTPEQKERIKAGVSKEAKKAQDKQEWEDFKGTEMYTMMFEDLEHYGSAAIDALYKKLSELKTSLSDLPASEVKEIVGQIEKLENIQIERNPFEYLKIYKDEVKNIGFTEDELQTQLLDSQKAEEEAQKYIDIYNTVMQSLMSEDEGVFEEIDAETLAQWNQMLRLAEQQGKTVEEILADRKATVKTEQDNQGKIVKNLNSYKKLNKSQESALKTTEVWLNSVGDLFSSSKELMEALGVSSDSVAMTIADTGSSMVSLTLSAVQFTLQLQAMDVAANSALGVIGYVAIAIQALAAILSAVFNYADKMRQMKLDVLAAQVDNLRNKFDALSESIDEAWSYQSLKQYEKELDVVSDKMIKAQKQYIAMLDSGKNRKTIDLAEQAQAKLDAGTSVDGLSKKEREALLSKEYQDYKEASDALLEMEQDYSDKKKDILEDLGGVINPKDAAAEFVDAWVDAFRETGDGLSGLEESFDEFFVNLLKRMAVSKLAETHLTGWIDAVNSSLEEGSEGGRQITDAEKALIKQKQDEAQASINSMLLSIFDGVDFGNTGGGLSALQKGVQGITEETAQVIEAYMNSIRGYVSEQVTHTRNIYRILNDAVHSDASAIRVRMV